MLQILLAFTTLFSFAHLDKTFSHDNSFCHYNNEAIEIEIRSFEQYSEKSQALYGEHVVIVQDGKKHMIPMNDQGIGRYRLFRGESADCSKVQSIRLNKDELAIFLFKDNKPFADLVTILFYNVKTRSVENIKTSLMAHEGKVIENRFYFQQASEKCQQKTGTVMIEGLQYTYLEQNFEPWMVFDGHTIEMDREMSYQQFEWKHLLKPQDFDQKTYQVAINHKLKRTCLSVDSQTWKC